MDLCSSDDELPAPGDPKFFSGLAKRKRRSSVVASSQSSSVGRDGDSSDGEEEESPKKIARKVGSALCALACRMTFFAC